MTAGARRGARPGLRAWGGAILDLRRTARALRALPRFLGEWRRYSRLPGAEPLDWREANPQLHDRTSVTDFDAHYFYVGAWAARRIAAARPALHVDVGSHNLFVGMLAATAPVVFVDYRPLRAAVPGLIPLGGSLLGLPFATGGLASLSCLHVAEHVGLGRYGDPLDPEGTRKAAAELERVLAPGGDLYFALPVGRPRVCFNAHRVHAAGAVRAWFAGCDLVEFAGVGDDGAFMEAAAMDAFDGAEYGCGFFRLRKVR